MQESQSFLRMDAAGALITYPLMNTLASLAAALSMQDTRRYSRIFED